MPTMRPMELRSGQKPYREAPGNEAGNRLERSIETA
jgi:hypothetical protein